MILTSAALEPHVVDTHTRAHTSYSPGGRSPASTSTANWLLIVVRTKLTSDSGVPSHAIPTNMPLSIAPATRTSSTALKTPVAISPLPAPTVAERDGKVACK